MGDHDKGKQRQVEMERLVDELQAQQHELVMQNQALRDARALLEDSRNRYADLYDFAPIGYCTVDREGRVREINIAAAQMLGLPRDLGRRLASAALVRDVRALEKHVARALAGEPRVVSEVKVTLRDRPPGTLQLVSCPIRDERGSVDGCRTALIDVTPTKEAEGRLRLLAEAGELFASSLDHRVTLAALTQLAVPALAEICFVDIVTASGIERRDIAVDPTRVSASVASKLGMLSPRAALRDPQEAVIRSGRSRIIDERCPSLATRDVDEAVRALRDAGITSTMIVPLAARGRAFGALTFFSTRQGRRYKEADLMFAEDVGRRAAMAMDNALLYERTEAALRTRDAVMALVSHDLRNPLAVIRLQVAAQLKSIADAGEEGGHMLTSLCAIERAAKNMDRLIADLLDVASLDAGGMSIREERLDAAALAREAVDQAAPLAQEKEIRLRLERAEPLSCRCDRVRILQVLQNLIGNAIKFTPPLGEVRVHVEAAGADVRFSVCDSGPGIARKDQHRIFERFWRGDQSAGQGLGLSIAEGLVRAHGGRIWVESECGRGATFHFTLRADPVNASTGLREAR